MTASDLLSHEDRLPKRKSRAALYDDDLLNALAMFFSIIYLLLSRLNSGRKNNLDSSVKAIKLKKNSKETVNGSSSVNFIEDRNNCFFLQAGKMTSHSKKKLFWAYIILAEQPIEKKSNQ